MIASLRVPCFRLTEIFRQAKESQIIRYAHQINQGNMPPVESPFNKPEIWENGTDCFFMDSDEATNEQMNFVSRVKRFYDIDPNALDASSDDELFQFRVSEAVTPYETEITIPKKFQHVNLEAVYHSETRVEELVAVVKKVHPWSSLHYGISAVDVVRKLYIEWIPKYFGNSCEIQILSPMTRGSLGTLNLNQMIQETANPAREGAPQLKVGERIFRVGTG